MNWSRRESERTTPYTKIQFVDYKKEIFNKLKTIHVCDNII